MPAEKRNLATGEELSKAIKEANEVRQQAIEEFSLGEMTFDLLVEKSRGTSKKHKPLSSIKVVDLFVSIGWSKRSAEEALVQSGIDRSARIKSVRNSGPKMRAINLLIGSDKSDWGARPVMPYNWPWGGKFEVLQEGMTKRERMHLARDFGLDTFVSMTAQNDLVRQERKDSAAPNDALLEEPTTRRDDPVDVEDDDDDLFDGLSESDEEETLDDDLYEGL